ncbi:hypothetical protein [Chitinophaga sp.]|uniref:hypothetical protein n=1 Tax=Chitinophaga sp. TaxID=1869181 RepID=UPI0031D71E1D
MKRYLYLTTVVAVLSCNNNVKDRTVPPKPESVNLVKKDKDDAEVQGARLGYKQLPPLIKYLTSAETGITDPVQNIKAQEDFLSEGLPVGASLLEWKEKQGNSWEKADKLYADFVNQHKDHKYISDFRQYGAYVILVKLNLLGDDSPEGLEKIYFYLNELVKGNSINTPLISYGLSKLKEKGFPETKISDLANKVKDNLQSSSRFTSFKSNLKQSISQPSAKKKEHAAEEENHVKIYQMIEEGENNIKLLAQSHK